MFLERRFRECSIKERKKAFSWGLWILFTRANSCCPTTLWEYDVKRLLARWPSSELLTVSYTLYSTCQFIYFLRDVYTFPLHLDATGIFSTFSLFRLQEAIPAGDLRETEKGFKKYLSCQLNAVKGQINL